MDKRIEKWKKKLSGDNRKRLYDAQKSAMVEKEKIYFADAEKIQNQVKSIVQAEPSIFHHYYMDFAMEIYRLLKTHKGQTLLNELIILNNKWEMRGLNTDLLNEIKTFFVPAYVPIIPYWFGDWLYRQKLTFDNTASGTDLDDFPILVHLTNANFDFSHAAADGRDIRFKETDDGPFLKYEIERWTANEAWIWVKVPKVDAGSAIDFIYMYYGSATATDDQDPQNVWDNNFVMVQHMRDDPDNSHITDSTSNNNDGTKKAANEPIETTNGRINDAQDFDGNDDDVEINDNVGLRPATFTISVWIRKNSEPTNYERILVKWKPGAPREGWIMLFETTTPLRKPYLAVYNTLGGATHTRTLNTILPIGEWRHLAYTFDGSNIGVYENGVNLGSVAFTGTFKPSTNDLYIGREPGATTCAPMRVDETRISNTTRTPDWIEAQHLSMTDAFITYGPEEEK